MSFDPHESEAPRPRRTPRRILRWLGKLFLWAVAFVVAGLVLALVAGLLAYSHRERLVNQALARFVEPFEVSVGRIDLSSPRLAVIEDLRLTPRGLSLDEPLLAAPTVEIQYGFHELMQQRRMRAVTLYSPRFLLNDETLAALRGGLGADPQHADQADEAPDLSVFHIFSEAFSVHDASLAVDLSGVPRIETRWSLAGPPLLFETHADGTGDDPDAPAALSEPFSLVLRDLRMDTGNGGTARVPRLGARFRIARDLSRYDFERVDLEGAEVVVTPGWFFSDTDTRSESEIESEIESDPAALRPGSPSPAASGPSSTEPPGVARPQPEWRFSEFRLGPSSFALYGFDGRSAGPRLPELSFDTAFQLAEVRFADGRWSSAGPVEAAFENVAVGPPSEQLGGADRLLLSAADLGSIIHERNFGDIRLLGLDVLLSDDTLSRCRPLAEAGGEAAGAPQDETAQAAGVAGAEAPEDTAADPEAPPTRPWIIGSLEFEDAAFLMRALHFGETSAPRVEARVSASLEDLRFGGGKGFDSEGEHEISLARTRLHAPGSSSRGDALLAIDRASLAGAWRPFADERRLDRFHVEGLGIHFADETLGEWLALGAADADPSPDPRELDGPVDESDPMTETAPRRPQPVYRIADLAVSDGVLLADSTFADRRVPKIQSRFHIGTATRDTSEDPLYRLVFEEFRINNHAVSLKDLADAPERTDGPEAGLFAADRPLVPRLPVAEEEVITIESVEMLATANQLQAERKIRSVRIDGAVLTVGQGLRSLAETSAAEDAEPEPEPEPEPEIEPEEASVLPADSAVGRILPYWTLEEVEITRSQVRFESLIPQIEGLEFTIETSLKEVPLSPDAILSQDAKQKVELSGIEIRDPYDSFITVAELPTIFVEFSLAGLARQEIERIDLISPALHVGQGLFWWIDYQRNFRAQNEGASVGIGEDAPVPAPPDWVIKSISANAGRIIVAPTGIPIGVVPFPFNATTNMEDGRIELFLSIPDEDHVYSFPDFQVELHGLEGNVEFNVPIQQVSNNLVQTFALDRIVWKDYEASNLYLTVTFDADGIYGALGGEAYGGYAEGQFNFYLDDPGKWDAWIAGTDLDTGPITQVLTPDNFLMEGKVSLKLVSEGRRTEFGETTGEFRTTEPGWFDVTKLSGILDELPEEWNSLQRSVTELSLIALKRFDYDRGTGSLYLLGQDGLFTLDFTGPYGSRSLNLQFHDQRNTNTATTATTATTAPSSPSPRPASEDAAAGAPPLPEASARPVARR